MHARIEQEFDNGNIPVNSSYMRRRNRGIVFVGKAYCCVAAYYNRLWWRSASKSTNADWPIKVCCDWLKKRGHHVMPASEEHQNFRRRYAGKTSAGSLFPIFPEEHQKSSARYYRDNLGYLA
jgi:hypothetical protein